MIVIIIVTNVADLDLNLLRVLHAVLSERSATRAARQLHVTQSAVSNSLSSLRKIFGDPLVVRSGRGLSGTPRADELQPLIASALAQLESVFERQEPFDRLRTTRQFTLACADADQVGALPSIAEIFAERMPRARLRAVSVDYLISMGGLSAADVDALLGPEAKPSPGFHAADLYEEEAVIAARRDHPRVRRRMTRELFNSLRQVAVLVALGRGGRLHGTINDFFARQGLRREVAVSVPHFSAAALIVARTDFIAAMPKRLAETMSRLVPLKTVELPGDAFHFSIKLHWHARTHVDPGAQAFRNIIIDALKDRRPHPGGHRIGPAR